MNTLKLPGWKPQGKPDEEMCKHLRQYIVEAVFSRYRIKKEPVKLLAIFYKVSHRVEYERAKGLWPRKWGQPGKSTIDRRVREAASPAFYEDRVPKIVAVTAGQYIPNPELFQKDGE